MAASEAQERNFFTSKRCKLWAATYMGRVIVWCCFEGNL